MSIRLRLVLWYGGLFALVLLLVTLLSNVFHVRSHYDDRDQALISSVGHAITEAHAAAGGLFLVEGSSPAATPAWISCRMIWDISGRRCLAGRATRISARSTS